MTSGDWILDPKHWIIFHPRSIFTQDFKQQWSQLSDFGSSSRHRVPEKNASAGPEAGLGHRAGGRAVLLCPSAPLHSHVQAWDGRAGHSALQAQGSPARRPGSGQPTLGRPGEQVGSELIPAELPGPPVPGGSPSHPGTQAPKPQVGAHVLRPGRHVGPLGSGGGNRSANTLFAEISAEFKRHQVRTDQSQAGGTVRARGVTAALSFFLPRCFKTQRPREALGDR